MTWLALGFGLLLLLAVIGVTIYTRTERFTRWARDEAVNAANGLIQGSISVERLEGSIWRHLVLHNVKLRYQDEEILIIPRLEISFSLLPLIWSELRISSLQADAPRANLLQDREGNWNVVEALLPRNPEPEKKSEFVVLVDRFRLINAAIHLRPIVNESTPYDLTNLNLHAADWFGVGPRGFFEPFHQSLRQRLSQCRCGKGGRRSDAELWHLHQQYFDLHHHCLRRVFAC